MGSVWLADHHGLGTQVAVKFMSAAVVDDPVSVARFNQEAKAAAQIKSPHVVQIFDQGITAEGDRYIVMELLEGDSLDKWCKHRGLLSLDDLSKVVSQVCKALAKAHELGIIHRDIKPANIFLSGSDGDFFVKVLDFGVAKLTGEDAIHMTAQGNMVGTPAYMSPEQFFQGKKVTYRCDLWSLGVVAYQALTGRLPFEGVTIGELCVAIKQGEFAPPSSHRPELPAEVNAWFGRALHVDPLSRFQSAKEMAMALELLLGTSTIMASSPSLVATGPSLQTFPGTSLDEALRSQSRGLPRRSVAVAAAITVAVIGGVGTAAFLMTQRSPAPATGTAAQVEPAPPPVESAAAAPDPTAAPEGSADEVDDEAEQPSPSASTSAGKPPAKPVATKKPPVAVPTDDDRARRAGKELGI